LAAYVLVNEERILTERRQELCLSKSIRRTALRSRSCIF
jgi:hypothetical protein